MSTSAGVWRRHPSDSEQAYTPSRTRASNCRTRLRTPATAGGHDMLRFPLKTVGVYAILLTWTVWIGYPLYWLMIAPFKPSQRVGNIPFVDFVPTVRSFVTTFRPESDAHLALTNSVIVSISAACIALVLGAMAGYALARFRYRVGPLTNDRLSFFFLAQRMFPIAILSVPYLILFRTLNLLDTPLALVLGEVGFGTPFVAWLIRDFFVGMPADVEEAQ